MANFCEVLYIFEAFHTRSQYLLRGGKYLAYGSVTSELADENSIAVADLCVAADDGDSMISRGGMCYAGKNA
jgi:hypothetical protein